MEVEALRSWLESAVGCRALVSSADVLAACAANTEQPTAPPVLETIGFPTGGDRTDLVGRAVASFARNAAAHARKASFLVSDGSHAPDHQSAFREAGARWAREHGTRVLYAGAEEKRRLAAGLIRRGCREDTVEFALFDPLGIGFTCGANRNAMLLHQAGSAFCSVDDDVFCELAAAPATTGKLRLFSTCDPYSRWMFSDRESAVSHANRSIPIFSPHTKGSSGAPSENSAPACRLPSSTCRSPATSSFVVSGLGRGESGRHSLATLEIRVSRPPRITFSMRGRTAPG
jgi:hypothetical protein